MHGHGSPDALSEPSPMGGHVCLLSHMLFPDLQGYDHSRDVFESNHIELWACCHYVISEAGHKMSGGHVHPQAYLYGGGMLAHMPVLRLLAW